MLYCPRKDKNTARLVVRARRRPSVTCLLGCPFLADHWDKEETSMEQVCVQLTVLFEEPFWIGLCERQDKRREKHRGH